MATEVSVEFARDLIRDTLDDDKARRLLAALSALLSGKTVQQAEMLSLAISGTRELNPPTITDFDVLFIFVTKQATVQLASGGTSITIAAGGFLMLHTAAMTYLKITMGATAGTAAFLMAS